MISAKSAKVITTEPTKENSTKGAEELNKLSHMIIGISIDVHKKLGPGFQEKIYEEALLKEFENSGIGHEKQKVFSCGL